MAARRKKTFKRASHPSKNKSDECGVVRIQCVLVERVAGVTRSKKGNIVRTMTVAEARVSEVISAIEEAILAD